MKIAFLAVVMSLAARSTSYAGPLGIVLDSNPMMTTSPTSNFVSTSYLYNTTTGVGSFSASGWASSWNAGGGNVTIAERFLLTATFSGGAPTAASLTIGSVPSSPFVSASGLAGFAFTPGKGGTIEFLFDTVGGTSGVFSSAAQLDVQLTLGTGGFFSIPTQQFATTNWSNTGGVAVMRQPDAPTDTVPEPSALLALVVGGGGLLLRRRRAARTIA